MITCALYHHIGEETAFERGLNITTTPESFKGQIDWMSRNYNFISLDQLIKNNLPPRPLLLTFDDVFFSVVEVVKKILSPREIPSVFFVNPGLLSKNSISIDSALAWATNNFGVERVCEEIGVPMQHSLRDLIIGEMSKYSAQSRRDIKNHILKKFGPIDLSMRAPVMSRNDLHQLPGLGVEIGNHTATHVHCRSLKESEIPIEIAASKKKLEELSNSEVRSFSIPYGHEDDLTLATHAAIRASGHTATFLVHARANIYRPALDVWYRTSLRNEAPRDLAKRLKWQPLLRSAKNLLE
jgi:peptidoglycan/xylan/chitin deacetylase (PgdA/CDA1 family)